MILNAKNGTLPIRDTVIDWLKFGYGEKALVMIPGLGDAFKTAKGMALPFALMYRQLAKDYTVYYFSRRRVLPEGFTTKDMAADLYACMKSLGLEVADVFGVSEGGMIAQHLAIDHPECVDKLILAVTIPFADAVSREAIGSWLAWADDEDGYQKIFLDTAKRSYTPEYLKKSRLVNEVMARFTAPASMDNFRVQANACLNHDTRDLLSKITAGTLIIGAAEDDVVGVRGSYLLHEGIADSQLYVYPGYSHGVYEEAKDFLPRIMAFLKEGEEE